MAQCPDATYLTGHSTRLAARSKTLTHQTSGLAPTYLQANLIVLPSRYADDFRLLCARNPVPCPLLAESARPGDATQLKSYLKAPARAVDHGDGRVTLCVAKDVDLRHDFPKYRLYRNGQPSGKDVLDVSEQWTDDHVGFLIGCSYSFESALSTAGLTPRQILHDRNVPMYRTTLALCPAGIFTGATYVVSMRPYRTEDIERVRHITRAYTATHGEPIAWGWEGMRQLGIAHITAPQWGQESLRLDGSGRPFDETEAGYVPVFWGCGVTPQHAAIMADLDGLVMGHSPGHMIVLDVREDEVFPLV